MKVTCSTYPTTYPWQKLYTGMDGQPGQGHLTWFNVGIGLLFLVADAILSLTLKLGVEVSLLTAAARCIIQLSIMVRFISPLFTIDVLKLYWKPTPRHWFSKRYLKCRAPGLWLVSLVRSTVPHDPTAPRHRYAEVLVVAGIPKL